MEQTDKLNNGMPSENAERSDTAPKCQNNKIDTFESVTKQEQIQDNAAEKEMPSKPDQNQTAVDKKAPSYNRQAGLTSSYKAPRSGGPSPKIEADKSNESSRDHMRDMLPVDQRSEPISDTLVGLQAQNMYLVNYINKLEFLLTEVRQERRRESKHMSKQIAKVLKAVSKSQGAETAENIERYIGLVGHDLDSASGSLQSGGPLPKRPGQKRAYRSLMFNYNPQSSQQTKQGKVAEGTSTDYILDILRQKDELRKIKEHEDKEKQSKSKAADDQVEKERNDIELKTLQGYLDTSHKAKSTDAQQQPRSQLRYDCQEKKAMDDADIAQFIEANWDQTAKDAATLIKQSFRKL